MNKRFVLAAVLSITATGALAEWKLVESKSSFSKNVVGYNFIDPKTGGWFSFRSNGGVVGAYNGNKLRGTWKWQGPHVCYKTKIGSQANNACVKIHLNGSQVSTTRQRDGRVAKYVRKKS